MNEIYIFDLDDTIVIHENNTVNYDKMNPDETLHNLIKKLDTKELYIYTNGTYDHAELCLKKIKLFNIFQIFARDTIPSMKPYISSYYHVQKRILKEKYYNNDNKMIFFDDNYENLRSAKKMGWITVWIHPKFTDKQKYMDYSFPNIYQALLYFTINKGSI
jgi:FMN phosphatase YigB (HAD superfamily)